MISLRSQATLPGSVQVMPAGPNRPQGEVSPVAHRESGVGKALRLNLVGECVDHLSGCVQHAGSATTPFALRTGAQC